MKLRNSILLFLSFAVLIGGLVLITPDANAETTCKRVECKITITIKIAFVGATNAQMQRWESEIENTWNEPNFGKCECDVDYEVETKSVPRCNHADAAGHHCIEVTAQMPQATNGRRYVAFMNGVSQNGASTTGKWWSNTSREIGGPFTLGGVTYTPTDGERFLDAAHEAGHMMGLDDDYDSATGRYGNNLMGRTWGPNARPTQAQINATVTNNCKGDDAKCPDECCCGRNKKVDGDTTPPEECDPSATPNGCKEGETCTDKCKCIGDKKEPLCGDAIITPPEECDPAARPTGCKPDENCQGCVCKKKETPPPPDETPEPEPEPEAESADQPKEPGQVCGDSEITGTEQCDPQATPVGCQEGYECLQCLCYYIEPSSAPDNDGDGVEDGEDNCPDNSNPDQADSDADGQGNACDPCTDSDRDGYSHEGGNCGETDCNDGNASIYPGAPEICFDGVDNNCNELVDEDCPICEDVDQDGYSQGAGECGPIDCDDFNPLIHPGLEDICDGLDNDCDGLIDEDCE